MAKNNETTAPVAAIKALVTSGGVTDVGKTTISKHIASLLKKREHDFWLAINDTSFAKLKYSHL